MGRYNFYVVFAGRQVGIFTNWADVKLATEGFPNARFKGYRTLEEAQRAYGEDPLMPTRRIEDIATTSNALSSMPTPFTVPPNEQVAHTNTNEQVPHSNAGNDGATLQTHMASSCTFLLIAIGVILGMVIQDIVNKL